jgi:hypothetical protein
MARTGRRSADSKPESFRERLGAGDIDINDYKVDDLRKIASEYSVSGSHDMHKEELVDAINKARKAEDKS